MWLPLVIVLSACSGSGNGAETGQAANRPPTPPFSADSAFAYLQRQVAFGPRVPGTPGHAKQLAWMKEFLAARADTVIVQDFSHTASDGKTLPMTNLFARFQPENPTRILLLAHWDTRPRADKDPDSAKRNEPIPGANDGASGVAVLLELANVLKSHSPPIGVDLLFVDGEDYGPDSSDMYLGATWFAAHLPNGYTPLYGILLDMIGDQSPVFAQEGNSEDMAPEVVQRVWRLAEEMGLGQHFPKRSAGYITDDHLPLNRAGIRTIDIIDLDYPYWHTTGDDVQHTSPVGLGVVGRVMTELIYRGG